MRRFQYKRTLFITLILAALILSTGAQTFAAQSSARPAAQDKMTIVLQEIMQDKIYLDTSNEVKITGDLQQGSDVPELNLNDL